MEFNELIEVLQHCGKPGSDCHNCKMYQYSASCLKKLCNEAADTLESQQKRIAELEAADRWIPVTERLPEKNGRYLVVTNRNQMIVNYSVEHQMFNCHDSFSPLEAMKLHLDCTHWMSLPVPPKEEGSDG